MKRVVLAAAILAATSATASAGGFVGLAVGGSPGISSDSNMAADGRSGRLELGYSFGHIAVEGIANRFDMYNTGDYSSYSETMLGAAGTYEVPLSGGFGVYGRLGLQHTSWATDSSLRIDKHYAGNGLLFGGGAQFKLPLAVTNLAMFVDYTITTSNLNADANEFPGQPSFSFTTRNWMLGAKLGF